MVNALLCLGLASAAQAEGGGSDVMARIDLDKNGSLSTTEYGAVGAPGSFLTLDTARNGAISLPELDAWIHVTQPRPEDAQPDVNALAAAVREAMMRPPDPVAPPPGTVPAPSSAVKLQKSSAPTAAPRAAVTRSAPPSSTPVYLLVAGLALAWMLRFLTRAAPPAPE